MSAPHRVLGRSSLPGTDGGVELVDHEIEVPLEHHDPDGRTVRVFARELRSVAARKRLEVGAEQPALVYLQGGPGGRGIRPPTRGWLDKLLVDYRVVMLDQRGTGRSTPATARTLAGMLEQQGAQATADYLTHFRARRDRRRRRGDAGRRCRRASMDLARAELRRVRHPHLPFAGTRGPCRVLHHRRAAQPECADPRGLRAHADHDRRDQRHVLLHLAAGSGRRAPHPRPPRSRPRAPAQRGRAHPPGCSRRSATCSDSATASRSCT